MNTAALNQVHGYDQGIINPASAADIKLARLPASNARSPSRAITGRWLGARPPVTAIWIAIELKLAKPHSMKVTTATLAGESPEVGNWLKATNSFSTTFVPNRPPAVEASSQGTFSMNMTGWKILPRIS